MHPVLFFKSFFFFYERDRFLIVRLFFFFFLSLINPKRIFCRFSVIIIKKKMFYIYKN